MQIKSCERAERWQSREYLIFLGKNGEDDVVSNDSRRPKVFQPNISPLLDKLEIIIDAFVGLHWCTRQHLSKGDYAEAIAQCWPT